MNDVSTMPTARFVGDTRECFEDLMRQRLTLKIIELIAGFCRVEIATVVKWHNEDDQFPRGEILLRLSCVLHLAGYEVTSLQSLNGDVRTLAMVISHGLVEMSDASRRVGYSSQERAAPGLLRVFRGAGSFREEVGEAIRQINTEFADQLAERTQYWQEHLAAAMGRSVTAPAEATSVSSTPPPAAAAPFDAALVPALGRSVEGTISLCHIVNRAPGAPEMVAAQYGLQLHELIELLQRIASSGAAG